MYAAMRSEWVGLYAHAKHGDAAACRAEPFVVRALRVAASKVDLLLFLCQLPYAGTASGGYAMKIRYYESKIV